MKYCLSLNQRLRLPTRVVHIGDVPLGGNHPIRIQSMTTTDTMNTEATVAQTLRMVASGSEYVRITAPSMNEARNLENIKKALRAQGCNVPLIADIHFTPNAAELAARIVEKVRVNPGNYADKKKFENIEYTDAEYEAELQRIHDRFAPLVRICKEYGTAMRIGTNHGSLSDRIMSRYGDSPLGMVESALEFLRICQMYDYHNVVLSMKASNTQVMVQAYRLLAARMLKEGNVYPLHLGVTEAGEGEDGRIKSAQGIGALLMDGIGDTVRVSLTEEPEYESPVAKFLVSMFTANDHVPPSPEKNDGFENLGYDPFTFTRRETLRTGNIGGGEVPRVIAAPEGAVNYVRLAEAGYQYEPRTDKYHIAEMSADFLYAGSEMPAIELPGAIKSIFDAAFWGLLQPGETKLPLFEGIDAYLSSTRRSPHINFILLRDSFRSEIEKASGAKDQLQNAVLILSAGGRSAGHELRSAINRMDAVGLKLPVIIRTSPLADYPFYTDEGVPEKFRLSAEAKDQLYLAALTGSLLVDGRVDGIWLDPFHELTHRAAFGILQAGRQRITKTEYISCPSCGRTLFDLQETTSRIRAKTEHLKGVKIGIMGCIVNGPGEMADADYGYVGVGPDKIALYRGKTVVEKGVKTELAVEKLIDLIRADGRWIEKEAAAQDF